MKSILDLIKDYSGANSLVPIVALVAIIVTVILHTTLKNKKLSYGLSLVIILVGAVILVIGYKNILMKAGLNIISLGILVGVYGAISLITNMILSVFDSMGYSLKSLSKGKKKEEKTAVVKNKQVKQEIDDENQDTKLIKTANADQETKIIKTKNDDQETKIIKTVDKDQETKIIKTTNGSTKEIKKTRAKTRK
ncbi:hypothetical protein [uncultured Helcococcus sp.]|uniref:hypothetical protein n=1 Tax=uncultured Helcococcus sp. TaxID=1072508 RepID=UPI002608B429|nr:hypothetical protein [uncultured Helcococcus sp.]